MRPNKLMGQNFLTSEDIAKDIVSVSHITPDDTVLEVGPGKGILTKYLLQSAKHVVAIEKDERFFTLLSEEYSKDKLNIIHGDILTAQIEKYISGPYKIVANLPYYLTSHFIRRFLEGRDVPRPESITVMVQKEVAERMIDTPPHMSMLSLSVAAYARVRIVKRVSKKYFKPQPKVDSAVVHIDHISRDFFTNNEIQEKAFFQLTKKAFREKRKKLRNTIGVSLDKRPQELALHDWIPIMKERNIMHPHE